jgi:hypothetical protein
MGSNLKTTKVQIEIIAALIAIVVLLAEEYVFPSKTAATYSDGTVLSYTVKPRPIIKAKQIGYISRVYEKDGERYLNFDDIKFLTGNEAIEAAKKDGNAEYEDGKYFVYNDYYIVNSSKQKKTYAIAETALFEILSHVLDPYNGGSDNVPVSYEKFKSAVNEYGDLLCYIFTENDVIVKVEGKYVP